MKLLIVAKSIDGGTGSYIFNLLKLRKLINLKTTTLILERPTYRKIRANMIFLHNKNYYPNKYYFSYSNILVFVKEIFWLKDIISQNKPDVVLSVNHYVNIQLSIIKYLFNKKLRLILTSHNNILTTFKNRASYWLNIILKILVSLLYKKANINIGVSKNISNDLRRYFFLDNVQTIYNGINLKKISIKNKINKIKRIISVGRLDKQKDFFTLIKAFSILIRIFKNSELLIIGDGKIKKNLKSLISSLKLSKKIHLIGWKQNVSQYLATTDLFLFSSNYEGFPTVILEAMSYGVPVISTNTNYGPSEILDNGRYGVLVPVGNEKAMAKAMNDLLKDGKKYNFYFKKSLERAKYFSLDKMLKNYKKIIINIFHQ
ncbi:MAG: glycosyltransferase [Patescibacteria group bacterium]